MLGEKRQKINIALAVRQTLFLFIVGKFLFKIPITWSEIGVVVVAGFLIEHALLFLKECKLTGISFASFNTSLSTAIMLGSTNVFVYVAGLFVGLAQKHFLRIRGQHFLNPSNVAILFSLLFFSHETFTISTPLGTTSTWWIAALLYVSAALIARSAKILLLAVSFIGFYFGFAYLFQTRNIFDVANMITSGNFILFAFYMVPDPKAIPRTKLFRIVFAVITAFLANALPIMWGPKYVNMFLALFLSELLVPLWRWVEDIKPSSFRIRVVGVTGIALVLASGWLYFSDFNYVRNLNRSFGSAGKLSRALEGRKETLIDPGEGKMRTIWTQQDTALYKLSWAQTHMEVRSLAKTNTPQATALATYKPILSREDLGGEYFPYAGITAGDVNHDGFLDLVVSKVRQKLRVYINDQKGNFIDVTTRIFEGNIPEDVEYVALADFNNDTWPDLLVVYSQYRGDKKNTIFFFDPATHQFRESGFTFGAKKRSVGGVTVWDINHDKKLDFYVSYGVDWLSEKGNFQQFPYKDEFYVSDGNSWKEALNRYFPKELVNAGYIGMTALFTDFNQDGMPDFLLGNDAADPSFTLVGGLDGSFHLIDKNKIEQNSRSSMSYFPADFDNDGIFELFEAGISFKTASERKSPVISADTMLSKLLRPTKEATGDEFRVSKKEIELGVYTCEQFKNPFVAATCSDKRLTMAALQKNDRHICESIVSRGERALCIREWGIINKQNLPDPFAIRFDPEKFAKKVSVNSLLRADASGHYRQVAAGDDVAYSNWTWTAYPFDVNNDGLLDLYMTSGAVFYSHDTGNKLLTNDSARGRIHFSDRTRDTLLSVKDDTRGVIIADFRNSGQGDIVLNNFMAAPNYFVNQTDGDAIEVELRSKNSNYFAVGAQIMLQTKNGKQIREVNQGGIWQSAQPFIEHFGIAKDDQITYLSIRWPDGHSQYLDTIVPNNRYTIYE